MKIQLTNPKIYTYSNKIIIGRPIDILNEDQIISLIQEALLKRSIICDNIKKTKKDITTVDHVRNAGEFL